MPHPEKRPAGRGRRAAPPPRDILAGRVTADDLPDVARPPSPPPPRQDRTAQPMLLPLRLTEAVLQSQAQAIDDWVASGSVPPPLRPGAAIVRAQIGFLLGMIRSGSGR